MKIERDSPLIGVSACVKQVEGASFHSVGEKYVAAVALGAGGLPVMIPALGESYDIPDLVERLDGLFVTGSLSNVAAHLYDGPQDRPASPQDPARDATTLPLIRAALTAGLPIFAVCRGLQELNVALGGTLEQQLHVREGRLDHRAPQDVPYEEKYGPQHTVSLTPDGLIAKLVGSTRIEVNSLHWQGIDRLADGLVVEGVAPDGVVEAVRVVTAKSFALGVQWHPEYRVLENPVSRALFAAFGAAARERARLRAARRGEKAA
ncbi:gamma-glutamyl-gamma-aminobutyrate hydrolase family protein [Rhodospirillaceae bacterium SYSU D60014]|uniref:gamma-glutamyl-gamma-aminobutyrate hydrolase family protein n=1 Tax=Virgifigura deserti TaxID=2268457 RepID=UPI000E66BE52